MCVLNVHIHSYREINIDRIVMKVPFLFPMATHYQQITRKAVGYIIQSVDDRAGEHRGCEICSGL